MALKSIEKKGYKQFSSSIISAVSRIGSHVLDNGRVAHPITDEPLDNNQRVITLKDRRGRYYILGGKR